MSNWGGYAANQGAFYLNEDAYLLIGTSALDMDVAFVCSGAVAGINATFGSILLGRYASDALHTRCE